MNSYRVLAIDLSYRDTGVAILQSSGKMTVVEHAECIKNPQFGRGFNALCEASKNTASTLQALQHLYREARHDAIIIEMPCFTQSAVSALAIGMCWGMVASMPDAVLIEPSALKDWSESKRGDKKSVVKSVVSSRVFLEPHKLSNDNIVDAVGIGLLFCDLISQIKYDNQVPSHKQEPYSTSLGL